MECEYCNKEHDGSYGSGRFCQQLCSRKYAQLFITEDSRRRQIAVLNDPKTREKGIISMKQKSLEYQSHAQPIKSILKRDIMHHPKRIGNLGEIATAKKFIEYGIPVYMPFGDMEKSDLIAEFNGKLQKIQVKASSRIAQDNSNVYFSTGTKCSIKLGNATTTKKIYSTDEVDYFAFYDYNNDNIFLKENDGDIGTITFRYTPPLNNNKIVNAAEDYLFENVINKIEQEGTIDLTKDQFKIDPITWL